MSVVRMTTVTSTRATVASSGASRNMTRSLSGRVSRKSDTLSPAARRRATARVAVTSSLFGIVRPGDRIPAYRLSGDAVLPGLGTVSGVWREELGPDIDLCIDLGVDVIITNRPAMVIARMAQSD